MLIASGVDAAAKGEYSLVERNIQGGRRQLNELTNELNHGSRKWQVMLSIYL
jgi:hypothetical protein